VASVNTDNADRDKHLQTPDYFDAAKFATISFKVNRSKKVGDKITNWSATYHARRYQTHYVGCNVLRYGRSSVHQKNHRWFKVTGKLNRKDFGVGAETPAAALSEEITFHANLEFAKG